MVPRQGLVGGPAVVPPYHPTAVYCPMPRQSYTDALRAVSKGEFPLAYCLHGPEEVLKQELLASLVEHALGPGEADFNLEQRDAASLDPESLHTLLNTLPMLAARRVAVLRGLEALKRKPSLRPVLLKYLERPAQETVLVMLQGNEDPPDEDIAAKSVTVAAEPLGPDRVVRWIGWHATRAGVSLEPGTAELLGRITGYDLASLRTELEKLASLDQGIPISLERVGELVGVRFGETLADWRDAVLADDPARALRLTDPVLGQAGTTAVRMVSALGTALLGLALARSHYDRNIRGAALERALFDRIRQLRLFGLGDWKELARDWARWAPAWPEGRLRAGLRAALEADAALKGTRISDESGVLIDLVLRISASGAPSQPAAPPAFAGSNLTGTSP